MRDLEKKLQKLSPFGLLLLRLWVGGNMAWVHGYAKFQHHDDFIRGISDSFPLPLVLGWAAIAAELGGGVLIGLGLFTRQAALLVLTTMLCAAFVAHADDPWMKKEFALTYAMISLFLVFHGGGRFSLDAGLRKGITGGPA